MNTRGYLLWLPSSYPSRLEPFDGDYVQRHAQAVSAFIPIHVLYFVRDKERQITESVLVEEQRRGDLVETVIYYSSSKFLARPIDQFYSLGAFTRLYKKTVSDLFSDKGLPLLVHVHIAFKAGIVARWIRKTYGLSYFLTEHATIYLDEAKPNFRDLNFFKRSLISKIILNASQIFCVSEYLARAIKGRWPSIRCKVIPNVVDTNIFSPGPEIVTESYHLIHISSLNYQKNPELLFDAIKLLKERGVDFSLDVFGVRDQNIRLLAIERRVGDVVTFHHEVPQQILAEHLRKSDLLILCSRYETFGCVVIEANACGIPVVVPDIPVMHELIDDNKNGVFVKTLNALGLAQAVESVLQNEEKFDKETIVARSSNYSYTKVGQLFFEEYKAFLNAEIA